LPGDRLVDVEARLDEDQLGTLIPGGERGHGRTYAELSRFVGRRGNHAAQLRAANRYGLAAQLGIVALLDRRIERVHVDVDDLADRLVGHAASVGCAQY